MFFLPHQNLRWLKCCLEKGCYGKKCGHLRNSLEDYVTCLGLALGLNEANKIFKFLLALFVSVFL